ncbi:protein phosphatase 1 regulatory subunit 36 [Boleophthalmus pectinirostris]|uniref:protein phosphatase 1 regulatory subunit 36 n=1 Tax=Boleophthalmus pectinirostris TaxID=150288 RepID=UPI002431C313|nr:protein phosphatase 1 regulatory subunit 36 [Boleophthalmus pectinirostris]
MSAGRWEWNYEANTVEFISLLPPEKPVVKKRRPTDVHFEEILQKSEWLAEIYRVNNRGRQSTIKSLDPALLKAYRSSVIENQGEYVTIEDVKQVAVKLLLENYSLPIPHCFLDLLKSKELDEILTALLRYLCCFFECKSLENKPEALIVLDMVTEQQMKKRSSAKTELALKRLAVCYFSLILDTDTGHKQLMSRMSSDQTEWLLEGVLYSFFCNVSWVTFGRKELKEIQDEIGRILYSDNFNAIVKTKQEMPSRRTSAVSTGSEKKEFSTGVQHTAAEGHTALKLRRSRSSLHSVVNSRSPLMASLLPSPQEQSPHLFTGPKATLEPLLMTPPTDSEELMEEMSHMSIGILGQPLQQFDPVTLVHADQSTDTEGDRDTASHGQSEQ